MQPNGPGVALGFLQLPVKRSDPFRALTETEYLANIYPRYALAWAARNGGSRAGLTSAEARPADHPHEQGESGQNMVVRL